MRQKAVWALIAIVSLLGCKDGDKLPSGILKPEKMETVMWDVVRADVFTGEYIKADSGKNLAQENIRLQKKIFAINNTTREEYYNSYEYYKSKPDMMRALLDTMVARVNRSRNRPPSYTESPAPLQSKSK
jgi:hypothetical protein